MSSGMKRYRRERRELVRVCSLLYGRFLVSGTDGNVSMRLGNDLMLITPSGVNKGLLEPDLLLVSDFSGSVVSGRLPSSKESAMHGRIYRDRPEIAGVVHTHPPYATAFAVAGLTIPDNVLIEVPVAIGPVALAPFGTPGTDEVPESLDGLLHDHDAILMANHGVTVLGKTLQEAYNLMDALENAAKTLCLSRLLGSPVEIPAHAVEKMKQARKSKGRKA